MTATLHTLPPRNQRPATSQSDDRPKADPAEVIRDIVRLALRHDLQMPSDDALELDAVAISEWPAHLWAKAYRHVWATWRYRRMPTVGDFLAVIAAELAPPSLTTSITAPAPSTEQHQRKGALPRKPDCPATVEDCIAAMNSAGPGTRGTWWDRAKRADPTLVADNVTITSLSRWVPVVAPKIMSVGLFGSD